VCADRDPRGPVEVLRDRRSLIAILALAGAAIGFAWGIADVPRYTANATLIATGPNGGPADLADLERYSVLGMSEDVGLEAAAALGGDVAGADLLSDVGFEPGADGATLEIEATSEFPDFAAASADAFAESLIVVTDEELRDLLKARRSELDPDSEEAAVLAARIAALRIPGAAGPLSVGAAAQIPDSPSSNRSALAWAAGGLLAGLLAGVGIALLAGRRSVVAPRPAPRPADVPLAAAFGVPVLGHIDERSRAMPRSGPAEVHLDPGRAATYRRLAGAIGLGAADAPRTLTFLDATSGGRADSIGFGVAVAAAELGLKVVIVEADLIHPTLASRCRVESGPGLRDYLDGSAGPRDVLRRVRAHVDGDEPVPLVCVPAGEGNGDGVTTVDGPRFEALVERLPRVYDLVLFESPPLLDDDDALAIARLVEGIVLVATEGEESRAAVERGIALLDSEPLIGGVLVGRPE